MDFIPIQNEQKKSTPIIIFLDVSTRAFFLILEKEASQLFFFCFSRKKLIYSYGYPKQTNNKKIVIAKWFSYVTRKVAETGCLMLWFSILLGFLDSVCTSGSQEYTTTIIFCRKTSLVIDNFYHPLLRETDIYSHLS